MAILALSVSACLNDQPLYDGDASENVVEFFTTDSYGASEGSLYPVYAVAFEIVPEKEMTVTLSYSGGGGAPQDIVVSVATDTAAITEYNNSVIKEARDAAIADDKDPDDIDLSDLVLYDKLPEELYTLEATSVTIPRGQTKATFGVKLKVDQFDLLKKFAIALTIKSSSYGVVSGNFSTVVYNVAAKNKYDGVYALKSKMKPDGRPTFSTRAWEWPYEIHLVTTGANSVYLYNAEYSADDTHPIETFTAPDTYGWSRLGSFTPEMTFDDSDKLVGIKNHISNPGNGRGAALDPNSDYSRYDEAKKTVFATFLMTQPGFAPLTFYDTLVYVKAR